MIKGAMILLLLTGKAIAVPTIYPLTVSEISKIQNNTNSNLVADNVDSHKVFVMPPSVASATVKGLHSITANVGFCDEMSTASKFSKQFMFKYKEIAAQELDAKNEADKVREKLFAAREEAAAFAAQAQLQDLVDIDSNIATIEARLTELYDKANTCTTTCDGINAEINDLVKSKRELLVSRVAIVKLHASDIRQYERRRALVANLQANLSDLDAVWVKLEQRALQIRQDFRSMYSSFGNMEGARASIEFNSGWDQNVARLRADNHGFDFEKIQTQKALVMSNISLNSSMPLDSAILSYEVGGFNADGKMQLASYPESISGNVRLSLIGTCPILHPEQFDINMPNGTDQMKYGLMISYEYPTVFSVNAKANYNMFKMYQKVVTSGSSGGLFSSRSWSAVEERNLFKDSFSVDWSVQDQSVALNEEEKANVEKEMRSHIFDRLANMALSQIPDRSGMMQAAGAPAHGSVVLANALIQTCPGNMYCVGASIALNVLDAIFGNSSVTSSYMQTFDSNLTEEFSKSQVVYKPAITSYK